MPAPPASVSELRDLLKSRGLRLKKSLGQNFVVSEHLLKDIVLAAEVEPGDLVVEVGPGVGTLTRHLALAAGRVLAVELDQAMVAILRETFSPVENVKVIQGDILKVDLDNLLRGQGTRDRGQALSPVSYKVVANLPYYITTAAIRKFLDHTSRPALLVLMVQAEVAQRILAKPGQMSLLAVSVQFYAVPSLVMRLPAHAFYPSPKVDSAVVRLDVRPERPVVDVETFFRLAQAGFGQRRKMLRNSLPAGMGIDRAEGEELLSQAGIDPERRAQSLSVEEWVRLTQAATAIPGMAGRSR